MENSFSLDELEEENITLEQKVVGNGSYLGLDISEGSTGVCIYLDGVKDTCNITVDMFLGDVHEEARMRRSLRSDLTTLLEGKHFDVIVIEDVFQGINAKTTRILYSLNTVIDDMILDGVVSCDKFVRVDNMTWKSWLYTVDVDKQYKGMSDKVRIEACLRSFGVVESGWGYQDRLDATGMVLGYLYNRENADKMLLNRSKKKVSMADVEVVYDFEVSDVYTRMLEDGVEQCEYASEKRWSKEKILSYLTDCPEKGYLTPEYVVLGRVGEELSLPIMDGGILGFWVKPSKLSKYVKQNEVQV